MDNVVESVDEKNFYLKEEEEEVLRQLEEIQQLQAPSSTASSGGSSGGHNNNYKFSETDVASVKTDMSSTAAATLFDARVKHEGSPLYPQQQLLDPQHHQQFSIQQQLFQRDDSPLQQQQQQQVFAYTMAANAEAQFPNTSALQNTITSLSCKGIIHIVVLV